MNHLSSKGLSFRSLLCSAFVALCVVTPRASLADLPRPPGWEPTCTLEKEQAKGGGPCDQCQGWKDPDPCQKALEDKGYTRRCTEGGAGSFVAVWCKSAAGAANTPVAPAPTTTTTTTPAATTNSPTPPPPVAPASDNRRGGGLCSVQVIGQDKREGTWGALVVSGMLLGLAYRRVSSRQARRDDRASRKNALPKGHLSR